MTLATAFTASWLVPRLGGFRTRHPGIELNIVTTRRLANFVADGVDVAIRHGLGHYPGLLCDRIAPIAMIPVCSPRFIATRAPRKPVDLLRLPLLHDARRQDWRYGFRRTAYRTSAIPHWAASASTISCC